MKYDWKWMMVFGAAAFAAGCGQVDEDAAACDAARDHVQACFPDQEAKVPASCDAESAQPILDSSCEMLAAQASDGSADGFCNPFFWWACTGGSSGGSSGGDTSSEPERTGGYSFNLDINVCQSDLCVEDLFGEIKHGAECGKITLETEAGEVVATDYINDHLTWGGIQGTGAGFDNLDLPAGDYTARLWRQNGELARVIGGEPAEISVSLSETGGVSLSDRGTFRLLTEEAEAVRACGDVVGTIESTCDGELMSKEDTEWSWIVHIEGANSEGTYENLKRSSFYFSAQANVFGFPKVRAGSYTLTYIEVDVSSWRRDDYRNSKYEDYLELVERYETGRRFTQEIEVTEADIAAGERVSVDGVALESEVCL